MVPGVQFAAVLDPPLGGVGDYEDLLAAAEGVLEEAVRGLVELLEEGLGLGADVEELEGAEVGGAEDGIVPVVDENCVGEPLLCWFFLRGRSSLVSMSSRER
jgi:hypothetical protein